MSRSKGPKCPYSTQVSWQLQMPWKYETVAIYSFWIMGWRKYSMWRSLFQDWRSQCQHNLTLSRLHVRLICPENMKQLSSIVSEYCPLQPKLDKIWVKSERSTFLCPLTNNGWSMSWGVGTPKLEGSREFLHVYLTPVFHIFRSCWVRILYPELMILSFFCKKLVCLCHIKFHR